MGIYICLIAIILFFDNFKFNNKKVFYLLIGVLTVVSVIRYNVGTDYIGYTNTFEYIKLGARTYVEWGYYVIAKFVASSGGKVQIIFAFMAIITNVAFGYTIIKNVENKYIIFSIFIYVCSTLYFGTMNIMRQYTAIAILLFGFEFLKERKYFKYILFVICAMQFHNAAMFMILYMMLIYINDRKKIVSILHIMVLVSIIFIFIDLRPYIQKLIQYMPENWRGYENSGVFANRNSSAVLKTIIPNILWYMLYYKYKFLKNKNIDLYMIGWAIYVIILNAFYGIEMFIRVYTNFEVFVLYIVPFAIELVEIEKERKLVKFEIVLYYIVLTAYGIFYKNGNGVIPYDTLFGKGLF